jgi:hypothetical protein
LRYGVRVTVVSTIAHPAANDRRELHRQTGAFIGLKEPQSRIGRDPAERAAPRGV